jgi:cobaltochelatase CobN
LKEKSGKGKPDTAFFDIRNKNNYISRTYEQEIDFEIRSKLLNPKYYGILSKTAGGMNSLASNMQNMYGSLVLSGEKLNKELGDQLAQRNLEALAGANDATLAPAAQSMAGWQIYMADQGLWDADSKKLQDLVDNYMKSVIDYGVACCHHTCKNLAFNAKLIQMSSLTPAQKQKFAEILAAATNTDPLYQMEQDSENNVNQGDSDGKSSGEMDDGNQKANVLTNNTSQEQSDGSQSGGRTSVGADQSASGNEKVASETQTSQDASSSAGSDAGAKAYELSEKSTSKSVSATESSMPVFVIVAVIVLIAIFLVGYVRDNEDDDDDY